MQKFDSILVHYGEIALKGANRRIFVERLVRNIKATLNGTGLDSVKQPTGRILLKAAPLQHFHPDSLDRLKKVYGIVSFAPAIACPLELETIEQIAWQLLEPLSYSSFRISARRAFKQLPWDSMSVNQRVGGYVLERRMCPVKMKGADVELHIEMVPGAAYVYCQPQRGLGGLPVGVTGDVAVMLSGGIDSPVAAWRMQQRGCRVHCIHFHSHPWVSKASQEKAVELAEILAQYQQQVQLHCVPLGQLQREVVNQAPENLRVLLYRRAMLSLAEQITQQHHPKAKALVTGEALGQVASQTLSNLVAVEAAASMPVFRPLIAMDKQEIVDQAQRLGSFDISIQPDEDCCSLFVPKHPATKSRAKDLDIWTQKLDFPALTAQILSESKTQIINAPWTPRPKTGNPTAP